MGSIRETLESEAPSGVRETATQDAATIVGDACGELLDRFVEQAAPRLRKLSDAIYEDLLNGVQDYLKENANWNLANDIERCWRIQIENARLHERNNELLEALKNAETKLNLAAFVARNQDDADLFQAARDKARAAIAKAESSQ